MKSVENKNNDLGGLTLFLAQVDMIVMEWHFEPPDPLLDLLRKNGFVCFLQNERRDVGMIRAVNKRQSV